MLKCVMEECEKILSKDEYSQADWIIYIADAADDLYDIISGLNYAVSDWEELYQTEEQEDNYA